MDEVAVTGMSLVKEPFQTPNGHMILAFFDAEVGCFAITGCQLVRTNRGGLAGWLPRLDSNRDHTRRNLRITHEPTRAALNKAAIDMYRRMGGQHGEWRPREPDEEPGLHPYRGSDVTGWPTHPLHPNYQAPATEPIADALPLPPAIRATEDASR